MDVFSVKIATIKLNSLSISIFIKNAKENKNVETLGLIDSGAGGKFIDQNYVRNAGFKIQTLERPIIARNVDGTENKKGKITSFVDLELTINEKKMMTCLLITGLWKQRIILGFPWLNEHNPDINWKTGEFTWRTNNDEWKQPFRIKRHHEKHPCDPLEQAKTLARLASRPTITEEPDPEEKLNHTQNPTKGNKILLAYLEEEQKPNELWMNAKTTATIEFHLKHDDKKENLPIDQQIPELFHDYLDVFDKEKADQFPEPRPWDHKIELKEGFQPKSFKTYNLTPEEQKELDQWTKDNLEKGYIRPSQSPMAYPFFYVKKKDGKLRPCQDY